MRYIPKNLTHLGYTPLKGRTPPSSSSNAISAWNKFKSKSSVRNALLDEQDQLCCYTEVDANQEGWGYHIEHIENKSQNPARTFDPCNLGACSLTAEAAGSSEIKEHRFGGHAVNKAKGVDMTLFVHCHLPNCAQFFTYQPDGDVVPASGLTPQDFARAEYTILQLNLKSSVLKLRRQQWYKELEAAYEEHAKDPESLQQLVQYYTTSVNNKLQRFITMSQQFFAP